MNRNDTLPQYARDAGYGDTRLLSNAEMDAVWPLSFYMTRPKNLIKAQLAKCEPLIRAKTLKEVGEWLGKQHCIKTDSHNATVILLKSDIQSLQKGEMPK